MQYLSIMYSSLTQSKLGCNVTVHDVIDAQLLCTKKKSETCVNLSVLHVNWHWQQ
jgi:hypothetical protein